MHNMGASDDRQRLIEVIARLRAARVVPAVADRLRDGAGATVQAVRTAALAEVEALTDSGNPDIVPELEAHFVSHLEEVCRLLAGEEPGNFEFVLAHAARRAATPPESRRRATPSALRPGHVRPIHPCLRS